MAAAPPVPRRSPMRSRSTSSASSSVENMVDLGKERPSSNDSNVSFAWSQHSALSSATAASQAGGRDQSPWLAGKHDSGYVSEAEDEHLGDAYTPARTSGVEEEVEAHLERLSRWSVVARSPTEAECSDLATSRFSTLDLPPLPEGVDVDALPLSITSPRWNGSRSQSSTLSTFSNEAAVVSHASIVPLSPQQMTASSLKASQAAREAVQEAKRRVQDRRTVTQLSQEPEPMASPTQSSIHPNPLPLTGRDTWYSDLVQANLQSEPRPMSPRQSYQAGIVKRSKRRSRLSMQRNSMLLPAVNVPETVEEVESVSSRRSSMLSFNAPASPGARPSSRLSILQAPGNKRASLLGKRNSLLSVSSNPSKRNSLLSVASTQSKRDLPRRPRPKYGRRTIMQQRTGSFFSSALRTYDVVEEKGPAPPTASINERPRYPPRASSLPDAAMATPPRLVMRDSYIDFDFGAGETAQKLAETFTVKIVGRPSPAEEPSPTIAPGQSFLAFSGSPSTSRAPSSSPQLHSPPSAVSYELPSASSTYTPPPRSSSAIPVFPKPPTHNVTAGRAPSLAPRPSIRRFSDASSTQASGPSYPVRTGPPSMRQAHSRNTSTSSATSSMLGLPPPSMSSSSKPRKGAQSLTIDTARAASRKKSTPVKADSAVEQVLAALGPQVIRPPVLPRQGSAATLRTPVIVRRPEYERSFSGSVDLGMAGPGTKPLWVDLPPESPLRPAAPGKSRKTGRFSFFRRCLGQA